MCKQTSFRACDWLLFLFTITILRRSYDELTTNFWRFYDHVMIFRKSGPWTINMQRFRASMSTQIGYFSLIQWRFILRRLRLPFNANSYTSYLSFINHLQRLKNPEISYTYLRSPSWVPVASWYMCTFIALL